jgi:hypothetical protein
MPQKLSLNRILWISARLPSPLFSGDALYSAGLIEALAKTSRVALCVVGTRRDEQGSHQRLIDLPNVTCVDLPASRRFAASSIVSSLPKDAFALATPELQRAVAQLLEDEWDWIVIDHAYSAGVLPTILDRKKQARICYVAHNAEGKIRKEIANDFDGLIRKAAMKLDSEKYRRLELAVVAAADAIISITEEDADYFKDLGRRIVVVPPVYLGASLAARTIERDCPRDIVLVGSFDWMAKQQNLEQIIDVVIPKFQAAAITLSVVGSVPDRIIKKQRNHGEHLKFHGRVKDMTDILANARGGLIAEVLGGGFKLKLLDYAFSGIPIFGIPNALTGMTSEEKLSMFIADSLDDLASCIVGSIDDVVGLNNHQSKLRELVSKRFGIREGIDRMAAVFL